MYDLKIYLNTVRLRRIVIVILHVESCVRYMRYICHFFTFLDPTMDVLHAFSERRKLTPSERNLRF